MYMYVYLYIYIYMHVYICIYTYMSKSARDLTSGPCTEVWDASEVKRTMCKAAVVGWDQDPGIQGPEGRRARKLLLMMEILIWLFPRMVGSCDWISSKREPYCLGSILGLLIFLNSHIDLIYQKQEILVV